MTDIHIFYIDGESTIEVVNGSLTMTDGPESFVTLCLFGGNEDDAGGSDVSNQWWGNSIETDPNKHYRSKTQNLLRSLPQTSGNLIKLKQAVESDLEVAVTTGVFSEYEVFVTVPRLNWAAIEVRTKEGTYKYESPWEISP
jgi:hypothetical protein